MGNEEEKMMSNKNLAFAIVTSILCAGSVYHGSTGFWGAVGAWCIVNAVYMITSFLANQADIARKSMPDDG